MSQMPSFLKIGNKPNAGRAEGEPYRMQDYKPLLGLWLIVMLALLANTNYSDAPSRPFWVAD